MWELDHKEGWMLKNWCFWTVVLEKTLEVASLLHSKEIKPVNPKGNQPWIFIRGTDAEVDTLATWCEESTHWKRHWCWERLKAGGEGGDRGWYSWMVSSTQWTWAWANSGRWWRAERQRGVLQSIDRKESDTDWATEQQYINQIWNLRSVCTYTPDTTHFSPFYDSIRSISFSDCFLYQI